VPVCRTPCYTCLNDTHPPQSPFPPPPTGEHISNAIANNSTLTSLNLEANRCGNDGATFLAKALATNRALITLNLLNQKGSRFGDSTLAAFTEAFDTNITLLKIVWRLESRQ
jgi:hypothetical protein